MIIQRIEVANLRAITHAEIVFQPGMNLLVGVNGVGKTTILEALRICLSQVIPNITISKTKKENFAISDIRIGEAALTVNCDFGDRSETDFSLLYHKQRTKFVTNDTTDFRAATTETPDKIEIEHQSPLGFRNAQYSRQPLLGVYFSSRRSLVVDRSPSKNSASGGRAGAFAEALSPDREFNQRLFAQWYNAQDALAGELPIATQHLTALHNAVSSFLPEFSNLHVIDKDGKALFMLDKNGLPISVAQMSDGERGVLSLVMDLAKRLSQANPEMDDPVKNGQGIVLIDEIDLHLHPQWQRSIVAKLEGTFSNCQFIATTHSPQIIGEVDRNKISIISDRVFRPLISFGADANRVLEEIMGTPTRSAEVEDLLARLFQQIDEEHLEQAKVTLQQVQNVLGQNDPEVSRSSTLISFLEDELKDEEN